MANSSNSTTFTLDVRSVFETQNTAVIVCDMWDAHWCSRAAARVDEMAPYTDRFICELRRMGVLVVHAPSETMDFYAKYPGRIKLLADGSAAPPDIKPRDIEDAAARSRREPQLPIDDSDGGCDCGTKCAEGQPWRRQHAGITISDDDLIGDGEEIIAFLKTHGFTHVLITGVHTNMCVVKRPFGIRKLVSNGFDVCLVRDLTDTMYDPRMRPNVDHFTGTDLVINHIERYLCGTVTSDQIVGGEPFRFAADPR